MALVPRGLLLVDPSLYIIIPLVSEGKSGQLAVWEMIHSTNKQYTKFIRLTLTHWSKPTPHSTQTDPCGVPSSESVASSIAGISGSSGDRSYVSGSITVHNHPVDQ